MAKAKRKRERPKRTSVDLVQASEHLHYEIWMFAETGSDFRQGLFVDGSVEHNALLEAFTIHIRATLQFIYESEWTKNSDVIAADYLDDSASWYTQGRQPDGCAYGSVSTRRDGDRAPELQPAGETRS